MVTDREEAGGDEEEEVQMMVEEGGKGREWRMSGETLRVGEEGGGREDVWIGRLWDERVAVEDRGYISV